MFESDLSDLWFFIHRVLCADCPVSFSADPLYSGQRTSGYPTVALLIGVAQAVIVGVGNATIAMAMLSGSQREVPSSAFSCAPVYWEQCVAAEELSLRLRWSLVIAHCCRPRFHIRCDGASIVTCTS